MRKNLDELVAELKAVQREIANLTAIPKSEQQIIIKNGNVNLVVRYEQLQSAISHRVGELQKRKDSLCAWIASTDD